MNKTYKLSTALHLKAIAVRTVTVTFCAALLFIVALGDITAVASVLHLSLIGSIIYEYAAAVEITVRMDSIKYKRGGNPRELRYEMYYFSGDEKNGLRAEDRRTGRVEILKCSGFDKKLMRSVLEQISKAQTEYFLRRNAAGEFKSGAEVKAADPDAEMKAAARQAAAEASRRNPYSKNYQGPTATKQPEQPAPKAAELAKTPAISVTKPAPEPEKASDIAVISEVTKSFDRELPKDYNKLPEVKLDDTAYRSMPEIKPVTVEAPREPEKKPAKPAHSDELSKIEFRYPKREICERTARANELCALWSMLIAVGAFLVWYLFIGIHTGGVLMAALLIAAAATFAAGLFIGTRLGRTRGIFSKLEITDRFLIIDNTRYRFEKMSDMHITAPDAEIGMRRLSFKCDGEVHTYSLGSCKITDDKRDIYAFPRYSQLCSALKKRGFTW